MYSNMYVFAVDSTGYLRSDVYIMRWDCESVVMRVREYRVRCTVGIVIFSGKFFILGFGGIEAFFFVYLFSLVIEVLRKTVNKIENCTGLGRVEFNTA